MRNRENGVCMISKVYKVNAFIKTPEGGNTAGIVINADFLSEDEMQKIAAKVGFSETAFVLKSDCADYRLRFFTPVEEVELCGHATIATASTLAKLGIIKPGSYRQETKAGVLGIDIQNDFVVMEQPAPVFSDIVDACKISDALNIEETQFLKKFPIQVVSTGLRDIIIPVNSIHTLQSISPNFDKIKNISRKYNVVGFHVFAIEDGNNIFCRNFAPLYDIPEEAATGTSNGALGCYLYQYGLINEQQAMRIFINQGDRMNKPSEILVSLSLQNNEITKVKVGGRASDFIVIDIDI